MKSISVLEQEFFQAEDSANLVEASGLRGIGPFLLLGEVPEPTQPHRWSRARYRSRAVDRRRAPRLLRSRRVPVHAVQATTQLLFLSGMPRCRFSSTLDPRCAVASRSRRHRPHQMHLQRRQTSAISFRPRLYFQAKEPT